MLGATNACLKNASLPSKRSAPISRKPSPNSLTFSGVSNVNSTRFVKGTRCSAIESQQTPASSTQREMIDRRTIERYPRGLTSPLGEIHMKRFVLTICLAASGCAPMNQYITPHQPVVAMQELGAPDYELLGQISGVACRDKDELKNLVAQSRGANKDFDEVMAQETVVYYEAKYNALESVPEADNMMHVRTKAIYDGSRICVTVKGRAYKLLPGKVSPVNHPKDGPKMLP